MKKGLLAVAVASALAGCTSLEDKQDRRQAEIEMVDKQMQARAQMEVDKARAQAALYNAMAQIAANNPDSADAIAVGMALAVSKQDESGNFGPVVTLSQEKDAAQEWAKILAAPLINTVGTVAVAGINASVQRNASDNMAKVSMQENETDARQFEALAGLGNAAAELGSTAIQNAGGNTTNTYNLNDESFLLAGTQNNDSYNTSGDTNTDSFNTTSTETNTTTNTETNTTTSTTTSTETNSTTSTTTTSGDTIDDNSTNTTSGDTDSSVNTNETYITNVGEASTQDIVEIVLNGGTVDIYTSSGPVTVDDDNLCTIFPDLAVCAP